MAKLSEEQITRLQQGFATVDTNGDGQITKEELKVLLAQLGQTQDDQAIDVVISMIDENDMYNIEKKSDINIKITLI